MKLRSLGFVAVGLCLSTSCAGRSERTEATRGGAAGAESETGGSGAGAGRGGAAGSGAGRGGESSTGGSAGAGGNAAASGIAGSGEGGDDDGGAGTGGRRPVAGVCSSPSAWSENLEECDGGFVHRPVAVTCPVAVRDELIEGLAGNAGVEDCRVTLGCIFRPNECTRDADCPEQALCVRTEREDEDTYISHTCQALCATDDDCEPGTLCACRQVVQNATRTEVTTGICTPGTCRTDSDCGSGSFCVSPLNVPERSGPGVRAPLEIGSFDCQTSDDECFGPEGCPDPPSEDGCALYATCLYDAGRLVCGARNESILCSP